jgi:hypothetical protein
MTLTHAHTCAQTEVPNGNRQIFCQRDMTDGAGFDRQTERRGQDVLQGGGGGGRRGQDVLQGGGGGGKTYYRGGENCEDSPPHEPSANARLSKVYQQPLLFLHNCLQQVCMHLSVLALLLAAENEPCSNMCF